MLTQFCPPMINHLTIRLKVLMEGQSQLHSEHVWLPHSHNGATSVVAHFYTYTLALVYMISNQIPYPFINIVELTQEFLTTLT